MTNGDFFPVMRVNMGTEVRVTTLLREPYLTRATLSLVSSLVGKRKEEQRQPFPEERRRYGRPQCRVFNTVSLNYHRWSCNAICILVHGGGAILFCNG